MNSLSTPLCNMLWLLSALPGWVRFRIALHFPKQVQRRILRRIIRQNRKTKALHRRDFTRLPLMDYEELLPRIEKIMRGEPHVLTTKQPFLLEPTGGSSAGTKLIPYTRALKKEFQRAINPWIAGLFLKYPSLMFGRHYWCITPATPEKQESAIPIGFDTDASYLGPLQQFIARHTFAIPPGTELSTHPRNAEFATLVHLLDTPGLRLISIWHPSLLTLMLDTLETHFDELIQALETTSPRRAQQLRKIGCVPANIWKKLRVISCWGSDACHPWIRQLQSIFPATTVQFKGLVATEGIASIPLGTSMDVAAVRSHYYEFECEKTQRLHPLWDLKQGQTYHLILTTGGGLYRYKTHDLVKVVGFLHGTPRIHFLTRNNMTSDLVGEKLALAHAEQICQDLPCEHRFAMIAPEKHEGQFRYALYTDGKKQSAIERFFESELCKNYHYRHARNTRQLNHSIIHYIKNGEQKIRCHLTGEGRQAGGIKMLALRRETNWSAILLGGEHEKSIGKTYTMAEEGNSNP